MENDDGFHVNELTKLETKDETKQDASDVIKEQKPKHMIYGISDKPPIHLTAFFGIQQALLSLSLNLTVSLLVAEAVCARNDEVLKVRLLCTTLFITGISTVLMVTIGVRLPLYQGPATAFVIPLAALGTLPEWNCRSELTQNVTNLSSAFNETSNIHTDLVLYRIQLLLFAIIIGWVVSIILTVTGVLSDDPNSKQFLARTDSRSWVIQDSEWFYFPYPGQFGLPEFSLDVFVTFLIATLISVIDSIGDYYACARICKVPPPPAHAVNRGILVEGVMSVVAGTLGVAHATTSYGPNLGALGITKVASIRVFVAVGILYIFFGLFGKFGAFFITIPYSVLGGITIISFGIFIGVNFSNMIYIELQSTRNLSIIGMSLLLGLMIPHWIQENPNGIETGVSKLDQIFKAFLGNPTFPGGIVAFILDNTIPGTIAERGLTGWLTDLQTPDKAQMKGENADIYKLPFVDNKRLSGRILKHIPFLPGYKPKLKIKI